jgi:hypothetical protein
MELSTGAAQGRIDAEQLADAHPRARDLRRE